MGAFWLTVCWQEASIQKTVRDYSKLECFRSVSPLKLGPFLVDVASQTRPSQCVGRAGEITASPPPNTKVVCYHPHGSSFSGSLPPSPLRELGSRSPPEVVDALPGRNGVYDRRCKKKYWEKRAPTMKCRALQYNAKEGLYLPSPKFYCMRSWCWKAKEVGAYFLAVCERGACDQAVTWLRVLFLYTYKSGWYTFFPL